MDCKSRLPEMFEPHGTSVVSNADIPRMIAPMLDTRGGVSRHATETCDRSCFQNPSAKPSLR